jgi:hypothetical protein
MFATAALVDMKLKDDRRKQWDIAIAEAKASSNVARAGDSSSTLEGAANKLKSGSSKPQSLVQNMALSILGALEQSSTRSPAISILDEPMSISLETRRDTPLEAQLKILDSHVRGVFTGGGLQSSEEGSVPVRIEETDLDGAPRHNRKLRDREPQDQVHLQHMQEMVLKLVTRFLIGKEYFSTESAETTRSFQDLKLQAKLMADQVALLKTGRIWRPRYSLLYDRVLEERKLLNQSITTILTTGVSNPENVDLMVAKICYNLLISSAPPSINTYNIMLIHFTRLQQHHLAQAVVDSFFEDSRFRPTSCTVAAILDHYAATGDRAGFDSVIQRMRGIAGDMRIGRRHINALVDPKTQLWAQQWNVIHRNALLIAKVPRNPLIFNSLILGSLRVVGVKRAVMYFKAALREGCHVTVDLFIRVAQACLTKRKKEAASALLSAIITRWHQCKGSWRLESYTGSRGIILQLMDLCGIELSINGNQRLPRGLKSVDFHIFIAWLRAVHLEVLDEYIRRSAESILGLELMLATSSSGASATKTVVLGMLELIDRHPLGESRREPGALVAAMQLAIEEFARSYKNMEAQFFDIAYAGLSANSRGKHDAMCKLLPDMDMTLRLEVLQNLGQTRQETTETGDLTIERNHQLQGYGSPSKAKTREFAWRPSVAAVGLEGNDGHYNLHRGFANG